MQLSAMVWDNSHFETDHKAASRGQVDLVQRGDGSGRKVCRSADRRWTVEGKDIGDVFTVEQFVDAEADLRSVKHRELGDGVVQEEIDVVIGRDVGLIVIRAVVVIV